VVQTLAALGVGEIRPLGFAGEDGEGFELLRALRAVAGVHIDDLVITPLRRTLTYCKPLIVEAGRPPRELSRLDSKNWTPTPIEVQQRLIDALNRVAGQIDALVILDQVDLADTGVISRPVLDVVGRIAADRPGVTIIADSRRGLAGYPPVCWKMNRAELGLLLNQISPTDLDLAKRTAIKLARRNGRAVFITLAEAGIVGSSPSGESVHAPAMPTQGVIDIVGAGDAVTANLVAALSAGASLAEAIEIANGAASVVIHQLGTTGTASVSQIAEAAGLLGPAGHWPK
jgi:bifunctional ADP-heptose synthase (sugar kinase/adenylyltransferase)